jgi:hypothetical protein
MMSIQSIVFVLVALMACILSSDAFSVVQRPFLTRASTSLNMGLFDAFLPKPQPKGGPSKKELEMLTGKGKRVTIREDEDNAMWIDEPKKDKKKGK